MIGKWCHYEDLSGGHKAVLTLLQPRFFPLPREHIEDICECVKPKVFKIIKALCPDGKEVCV